MMQQAVEFELRREIAEAEVAVKYAELALKEEELKLKQQQFELAERAQTDKEKTSEKQRELLEQQILESAQNVLSAERKVLSYDDQLLLKLTEMQSNVASFFVNASPTEAYDTLAGLNSMMRTVSARVDTVPPTVIPPIISAPTP